MGERLDSLYESVAEPFEPVVPFKEDACPFGAIRFTDTLTPAAGVEPLKAVTVIPTVCPKF
jgi:hypothetical protein